MTEQDNGQLDVSGFGLRARVRGHDIIVVVLVVILFSAVGYLVWDHDTKNSDRILELSVGQQRVIEEVSVLTYVMTLTPDERVSLKLNMPESLRKKLREQ